jgi:hypothetical protein
MNMLRLNRENKPDHYSGMFANPQSHCGFANPMPLPTPPRWRFLDVVNEQMPAVGKVDHSQDRRFIGRLAVYRHLRFP